MIRSWLQSFWKWCTSSPVRDEVSLDMSESVSTSEWKTDLERRHREQSKQAHEGPIQYEIPLNIHATTPISKPPSMKRLQLEHLIALLNQCNLERFQVSLFQHRFFPILYHSKRQYKRYLSMFIIIRLFLQTSALVVPALLSIQPFVADDSAQVMNNGLYWATWTLSIATGVITMYGQFFQLEKRTALYQRSLQKLESEMIHFLELSNNYSSNTSLSTTNHREQFGTFCQKFEEILSLEMDKEYHLLKETITHQHMSHNTQYSYPGGNVPPARDFTPIFKKPENDEQLPSEASTDIQIMTPKSNATVSV